MTLQVRKGTLALFVLLATGSDAFVAPKPSLCTSTTTSTMIMSSRAGMTEMMKDVRSQLSENEDADLVMQSNPTTVRTRILLSGNMRCFLVSWWLYCSRLLMVRNSISLKSAGTFRFSWSQLPCFHKPSCIGVIVKSRAWQVGPSYY